MSEWLTQDEALERLGVTEKALKSYARKGWIVTQIGADGHRQYSTASIEKFAGVE